MTTAEPLQELVRDGAEHGRFFLYREAVRQALQENYGELFAKQAEARAEEIYKGLRKQRKL